MILIYACNSSLSLVVTENEIDDDGNDSIKIAEVINFVIIATFF